MSTSLEKLRGEGNCDTLPRFSIVLNLNGAKRIDKLESRFSRMEAMLLESCSSRIDRENLAGRSNSSTSAQRENPPPQSSSMPVPTSLNSLIDGDNIDSSFIPTSTFSADAISYLQQTIDPSVGIRSSSALPDSRLREHNTG
jgi:hypothetical protein